MRIKTALIKRWRNYYENINPKVLLLFIFVLIILSSFFIISLYCYYDYLLQEKRDEVIHDLVLIMILLFIMLDMVIYQGAKINKKIKEKTAELNIANSLLKKELLRREELEIRFKKAQSMALVGNWELNINTMKIWFSEETYRIYGIDQDDSSVSFEMIHRLVCPEDRQRFDSSWKLLLNGAEDSIIEYGIIRNNDNQKRFIRVRTEIERDSQDRPIKVISVVQDITEQKKVEDAFRESERSKSALLGNLPGMAYRCHFDTDWTMEFVSDGCFELTGYPKEALIMNKEISFNQVIKEEDREFLWQKWNVVLAQKKVFTEEYSILTATGESKWVWEQGQGVYDEAENVVAIEGFVTDITERKKREDEIVYLSYHDMMTGLYNRRYYEEMKDRLDSKEELPLSVIIADINGLKLINDTFGHAQGDKLLIETAKILNSTCRKKDILTRTGGDEFCIFLPQTSYDEARFLKESIVEAFEAHKADKEKGTILTGIALGYGTKSHANESLDSVIKEAESFMYRRKLLQNKSLHSSLVNSIKTTLFEKSLETEQHAERLTVLSKQLGEKMGLQDEQLTELELLSALHDIGKIIINDDILNKPSALSEQERTEMKRHSEIGFRIAKASPELMPIADYILTHHEHWDGKGYPQGLSGKDIPLLSRILAVVDAYDAMTQDRPYRKAMALEDALAELEKNAGSQFDPAIVTIFIKLIHNHI